MTDSAFAEIVQQAKARIGTTVKGKWRIDCLLGVGGMASVYAATHRNSKRVAIKMLHPTLSTLRTVRERFQREGYVANSVGHSGAVSVDDDDVTEDGCAFLVMELLDGETLEARRIRLGGRLPAEEVLTAMEQVLSTLAAAHAKGIIHRDVKPDNLFLTSGGETKVLDFGIARLRDLALSAAHTQTGSMMGTPEFMSPEQARARWDQVDGQSDIWSIGATMFTLLSGKYVRSAATFNELVIAAATTAVPALACQMPNLPTSVSRLVDRALAFQKTDRWLDAQSMRREVRRSLVLLDELGTLDAADQSVQPFGAADRGPEPLPLATRFEQPSIAELSREERCLAETLGGGTSVEVLGVKAVTCEESTQCATRIERPSLEGPITWESRIDEPRGAKLGLEDDNGWDDEDPVCRSIALAAGASGEETRLGAGHQAAANRAPKGLSLTLAFGASVIASVVVVIALVQRRGGGVEPTHASSATAQAVPFHAAPSRAPEPRVTLESRLPRGVPVHELPLAPSATRPLARYEASGTPKPAHPAPSARAPSPPIVLAETPDTRAPALVHSARAGRSELDGGDESDADMFGLDRPNPYN